MTELTGSFISIDQSDIRNIKSSVKQLVDIVQSDIASTDSSTRKSYEVFTSGGVSLSPITSSLYQTVFDQDFTLGTSNPLFDITVGSLMEVDGSTITINGETTPSGQTSPYSVDDAGKLVNPGDSTAMVREKVNIYKQFAQNLLGDAEASFFTPHGANEEEALLPNNSNAGTRSKKIKGAVFICFRRLFTRDNIDKKSFVMRLFKNASKLYSEFLNDTDRTTGLSTTNISIEADTNATDLNTPYILEDSLGVRSVSPVSGEVSTLVDGNGNNVGLIYYDSGVIVLDAERAFNAEQLIRGLIHSTRFGQASINNQRFIVYGKIDGSGEALYHYPVYLNSGSGLDSINITPVDNDDNDLSETGFFKPELADDFTSSATRPTLNYPLYTTDSANYYSENQASGRTMHNDSLFPGLWVSGTIDTIVDHLCTTRFGRGNLSAIAFRNETIINSSLIFCKASPSQLNYSTNPTYKDAEGKIIATASNGDPFSYVTTIGLYDSENSLVAVAKTSRPIEKNPETDLSIRIRLDY